MACRVLRWWRPDEVVFLGDVIDADYISRFSKKRPTAQRDLQDELDAWYCVARYIQRKIGGRPRYRFIPGNHEHRLLVWQYGTANIALRVLSIPNLLRLKELGIEYMDREYIDYGKFVAKHGERVGRWGGMSAHKEVIDEGRSGVSGHCHRLCRYTRQHGGKTLVWVEAGCLCDNPPMYQVRPQNWQLGFCVATMRGSRFRLLDVPIEDDYSVFFMGREFIHQDKRR